MRDILTALAGVVILILVAALVAPPFVDWAGQRDLIDRTISASLGVPARSEGRITVRLLPSPRIRLDRLQLGDDDPARPALDARGVTSELALTPLIKGEFRFTQTDLGRAELRLPVDEADAILLPPDFASAAAGRDLVIEALRIEQALVTATVPATGRTDQFRAENVELRAPSLAGPWQIEGSSGGLSFRAATSALAPDGGLTLKLSGGTEAALRFEVETRVAFVADDASAAAGAWRPLVPEAEGSVRIVAGANKAAPAALAYTLGGKFRSRGRVAQFESVSAEVDPAGQALRLGGTGHVDLRKWRAGMSLESRRINLDGLIYAPSGQDLLGRIAAGESLALPILLDLELKLDSLALGFEDWSGVAFKGTFDRTGGLLLRRLSGTLAGAGRLDASGQIELAPTPRFSGNVAVEAANSEGLGRSLRKFGITGTGSELLDGRPVHLSGDVTADAHQARVDALHLRLGDTVVVGRARYAEAAAGSRGRVEADLTVQGLDISELPSLSGVVGGSGRYDLALTLAARDVRYGSAGTVPGKGTITAAIQSDSEGLVVDRLAVDDLAGASASLSGRIAADGTGRIAGRVSAPVAAPLVALLERTWLPEARLIPGFLREGGLDLAVSLEREPQRAESLRLALEGRADASSLEAALLTRGGRIETLRATLAGPSAGRWFGRDDLAGLRQPARLTLSAKAAAPDAPGPVTEGGGALDLEANGVLAGLALSTPQPIRIAADLGPPEAGKVRIETADLGPFLPLIGGARPPEALPAALNLTLARDEATLRAEIAGQAGGGPVAASLARGADGSVSGTSKLARLSLPALARTVVLPDATGRGTTGVEPARADLSLAVDHLDLGRGFSATQATLGLALDGRTLALRDVTGALAGGRLTGGAAITRQDEAVSISGQGRLDDAAIEALDGATPLRGRVSVSLRYSATGDTPQALEANLGGSGEVGLRDLVVPAADPAAIERAFARALAEDDPLREGRVPALLAEEFAAAPLNVKGPVAAAVTLSGGVLRSAPFALDLGPARWSGSFALDLYRRRLDARGTMVSAAAPKGWTGGKPSVQLGFTGPLSAPQREVDPGALTNGLAALVLQRELEKIEWADADQAERQRRRARIEMDKARAAALKAAAERAAQEKAAAEEAARQARQRAQQAAAEEEAKRAREAEQPPPYIASPPLDIRPP